MEDHDTIDSWCPDNHLRRRIRDHRAAGPTRAAAVRAARLAATARWPAHPSPPDAERRRDRDLPGLRAGAARQPGPRRARPGAAPLAVRGAAAAAAAAGRHADLPSDVAR